MPGIGKTGDGENRKTGVTKAFYLKTGKRVLFSHGSWLFSTERAAEHKKLFKWESQSVQDRKLPGPL